MLTILTSVIIPIFLIIAVGLWYASRHRIQVDSVNQINMDIFTPALIFSALNKPFPDTSSLDLLIYCAIFIVIFPGLLTLLLLKPLKWNFKTLVPPVMFRNSGNLGIPLLVFAFGEDILPIAITLFLVENTLHFSLGMLIIHGSINPIKILKTPMIIATILGISVAISGIDLPVWLTRFVDLTGQVAIPLMLFTLGVRLLDIDIKDWRFGFTSSLWAAISGFLSFLVIYLFIDLTDIQLATLLIFSILPPAVLNYLVAERYQIEPAKVATMVLFSNALSLIWLMPALNWVL